jgi:hypothetical protein
MGEILIEQEQECLRNFARHCHSFYLSSLSPSSSAQSSMYWADSSSSSSLHCEEEKKSNSCSDLDQKIASDGKIVLEAFDRICVISSYATNNSVNENDRQQLKNSICNNLHQNSLTNLRNEHDLCSKRHLDLLKECGLLELEEFTNNINATHILQKYVKVRDDMRGQAHKLAMKHRHSSFFELLSRAENDCLVYPKETRTLSTSETTTSSHATTVNGIKATISKIENFVRKYQSNLLSHSFLAGLHRFIHLQLHPKPGSNLRSNDPSYIIQWTIRCTVLSEAHISCAGSDDHAYVRDALNVLFSLMILSKKEDIEGGTNIVDAQENSSEPLISFEFHKLVSNATLRRILNVLPRPKNLDAKATGTFVVLGQTENESLVSRENIDGHLDEPWPLFDMDFRVDFCTLL